MQRPATPAMGASAHVARNRTVFVGPARRPFCDSGRKVVVKAEESIDELVSDVPKIVNLEQKRSSKAIEGFGGRGRRIGDKSRRLMTVHEFDRAEDSPFFRLRCGMRPPAAPFDKNQSEKEQRFQHAAKKVD
eukprot:1789296-Rhodomonas_salina.1